MRIQDLTLGAFTPKEQITLLRQKSVKVPAWTATDGGLKAEYDPDLHPVMDKAAYQDVVTSEGIQPQTRVTLNFQQLAAKRMTELVAGIPVKRVCSAENDQQTELASYLEKIFMSVHIDALNVERLNMLFAGCEVATLWYGTKQVHARYGFRSSVKLRCRNMSPMLGDDLYPLFDEYGDMTAMSVGYTRRVGDKDVEYFDTYTDEQHIKWSNEGGEWAEVENEAITLGKIPAVYVYRPTPIWENTSRMVSEIEWAMSRNGNYLRENSKPLFCVYADEQIAYGDEGGANDARAVIQFPKGSTANYITWQQAVESLKYHVETLRSMFFTQLQLPDWSYEKMSQQALSGESRKQMFIDSQLKVRDESGRLLEMFDREVNVVKAFMKQMLPDEMSDDIDALQVENIITPFSITDESDTINKLMMANGGEPIISQREAIEQLGWSSDVNRTLDEIKNQGIENPFDAE